MSEPFKTGRYKPKSPRIIYGGSIDKEVVAKIRADNLLYTAASNTTRKITRMKTRSPMENK